MEIEEIKIEKRLMENVIRRAVSNAMSGFYAKTSLSPRNINIEIMEVSTVGADGPQFIVSDIRADVVL